MLVPTAAGVVVLLDPVLRSHTRGMFVRLTTLDALPLGGPPRRFEVIEARQSAWTKYHPHRSVRSICNELVHAKCARSTRPVLTWDAPSIFSSSGMPIIVHVIRATLRLTEHKRPKVRARVHWIRWPSNCAEKTKYGCAFRISRQASRRRYRFSEACALRKKVRSKQLLVSRHLSSAPVHDSTSP